MTGADAKALQDFQDLIEKVLPRHIEELRVARALTKRLGERFKTISDQREPTDDATR